MLYLIHDLTGGLRETLNSLDELPEFIEWAEQEYPEVSKELIVRTYNKGQEIGRSRWAMDLIK